tara:strand:- start:246 stop:557 length:312 start_codon:yes stop_codon:yes gene_type:complete
MWVPKKLKYEDQIGKIARVYYFKEKNYTEGKLLGIQRLNRVEYGIQILDENKYTIHSFISNVIKKVEIKNIAVKKELFNFCSQYLIEDIHHLVSEYSDNFVEI